MHRIQNLLFKALGLPKLQANVSWLGISSETSEQIYHLAFETKSVRQGDSQGQKKGVVLDNAAEQVSLGVNGLIEFLARYPSLLVGRGKVHIVPAIFTTAELFSSDVDLGSANLQTGELETRSIALTSKNWLWWQYNTSPTLLHSQPTKGIGGSIEHILELEFSRSIAVVGYEGIQQFLARDWWLNSD